MAEDDERGGLTPFPATPPMVKEAAMAVAITIGALGCGDPTTTGDTDAGPGVGMDAAMSDAGGPPPPMPPPFDAGPGDDAGGDDAGPADAGMDAMMAPMVDATVPDAGVDADVISPMPPPIDADVPPPPMPAPFDGGVIARDAGSDATVIAPMPPPMPPPPMPEP